MQNLKACSHQNVWHSEGPETKLASDWRLSLTSLESFLELVSKELNHLAAILHVYAGVLIFMK